jgi:ketosteroid isomerase-like protein
VVRRTMAALARAFDAYWRDPRPIVRAYEAGKDSRPQMATRFYDVITIRDGKIARLEEYTTREEAQEAADVA